MERTTETVGVLSPVAVDLQTGAQLLGVGFTKFRELADAGEIATLMVGTRRLVRVAVVNAYAERREAETMANRGAVAPVDAGFAARVASRRGGGQ